MNEPPNLPPDDPRLTAYALGELDEAGCAAIEARLRDDPAARAAVEEIRATAARLEAALAAEPLPVVIAPVARQPEGRLLHWPRIYFLAGTLAAACFAVVVVVHQTRLEEQVKAEAAPVGLKREASRSEPAAVQPAEETGALQAKVRVQAAQVAPVAPMMLAANAPEGGANADAAKEAVRRDAAGLNPPVARRAALQPAAESMAKAVAPIRRPAKGQTAAFVRAADQPLAALPIEVDPASYVQLRALIGHGQRPPADAVRIAELLNSFHYHYPVPPGDEPFAANLEVAAAPWASRHRLVRLGLQVRAGEAGATMARDVQLEVKFNPAYVASYRLVADGEVRQPERAMIADYNSGGEFGAGESVTALFEIVPVDSVPAAEATAPGELLTFIVSYRVPGADMRQRREFPLADRGGSFASASADFKFAAAVAGFGLVLRDSPFKGTATLTQVADWAQSGASTDLGGEREAFVTLVRRAQPLAP